MQLKQQRRKYISHYVVQDFPALWEGALSKNTSDNIWLEESERMSVKAKPCLHQNPSEFCWRSSHHVHTGRHIPAFSQELLAGSMHTELLCSLCSLPTQPSPLHQHINQSLLAEAFVLCLHRKVWAHGSHSWYQHGMIFIDKAIIDLLPPGGLSPAPALATLWICSWYLDTNTDRLTVKPFWDVPCSS